ncbi:MAG: hypothetical protein A3H96_20715 [Acidobacteria bacterium RIFCSPLOWO2_02_FULL_67_36]|nr:MAG: hypothetical protein A3H96_20715 [Acidobacteria bacterium RIFCSPLOWO2_02_FULL_67_36]OFW25481.1 MAG: hypothetical protein A3G21_19540 [Acidobacteria bacterium RIFCSPLOWO2_12_FULL_66_21]
MDADALLSEWLTRARRIQTAHYEAAASLDRLQYLVGLPLVMLSTLVGTSIFATLEANPNFWVKVGVALASVLAAILAAIQTFLRLAERSEKHKMAGVRYGSFKREIEQTSVFPPQAVDELKKFIDGLRIRWDKLVEESPTIPKGVWNRVGTHEPSPART